MERSLLEMFNLGGWAMYPLVLFSVATIALFLERVLVLALSNLKVEPLKDEIVPLLRNGEYDGARFVIDQADPRIIVAPIYGAAIGAVKLGEGRIDRAFEAAAGKQIHSLERGLDLLIALGSIAPITGFLGTVSGMISAFNAIATAADVNAQLVASGIFEALITTAFGLAIAIVAITGYNIFAHVVDRFAANLEEAGNELVSALVEKSGKKKKK